MRKKLNVPSDDDHKRSGFWFGFALGTATASSAIFFLGTKKGRETLKRVLEVSEGLEETVFETLKDIGIETLHEVKDSLQPKLSKTFTSLVEPKKTIGAILEKIKSS